MKLVRLCDPRHVVLRGRRVVLDDAVGVVLSDDARGGLLDRQWGLPWFVNVLLGHLGEGRDPLRRRS